MYHFETTRKKSSNLFEGIERVARHCDHARFFLSLEGKIVQNST